MLFFTGYVAIQFGIVEEEVEKPGNTTLPCRYTDLRIQSVVAQHPEVVLLINNKGLNSLTGLTALVIMNDTSRAEEFYSETLKAGELKSFTVSNVNKPFVRIRFYGNACPSYYTEKESSFRENSVSGQTSSPATVTISNSGDVAIRPSIKITGIS
jgi:hypothetical protein